MLEEMLVPIRKYATFKGRARRREYWLFVLFYSLIMMLLGIVNAPLNQLIPFQIKITLPYIFFLAMFIPGLAVAVRRLQDTGRSGFWLFIYLVPILGVLLLLILMVTEGDSGPNRFGPNPKREQNPMENDILELDDYREF